MHYVIARICIYMYVWLRTWCLAEASLRACFCRIIESSISSWKLSSSLSKTKSPCQSSAQIGQYQLFLTVTIPQQYSLLFSHPFNVQYTIVMMSQCTMHRWYIQFIHLDIPPWWYIHCDIIAIVITYEPRFVRSIPRIYHPQSRLLEVCCFDKPLASLGDYQNGKLPLTSTSGGE